MLVWCVCVGGSFEDSLVHNKHIDVSIHSVLMQPKRWKTRGNAINTNILGLVQFWSSDFYYRIY